MERYATEDHTAAPTVRAPDFLTVEEAAAVLRIGRTAAYEATRRWRATGGAEGIAVVKVGGTLRVPRRTLEELAGGPVEIPATVSQLGLVPTATPSLPPTARTEPAPPASHPVPPLDGTPPGQTCLPFTS